MQNRMTLLAAGIVVTALVFIGPAACTQPEKTTKQLTSMGYKDVETTGYDFFACGKDDNFSTGFAATAPDGSRITGVYCGGLMKAGTVRFY